MESIKSIHSILKNSAQLTPDAAVGDEDEVVLGLVVGGTHVVYLGVHSWREVDFLRQQIRSAKIFVVVFVVCCYCLR